MTKEKTIDTFTMFDKPVTNTKAQWVGRWDDCMVRSLANIMPWDEYLELKKRVQELAGKDFDRRLENQTSIKKREEK
jgi:hypothetical protein